MPGTMVGAFAKSIDRRKMAEPHAMANDRWQRVERIFDSAAALPPDARAQYIADICGADVDLRADVESLLAHLTGTQHFLETPALEASAVAMALECERLERGTRIGEYEIRDFIAAGATGDVYRARDARLGRDVAIKTVSRLLLTDDDVRERFEREARLVASLSHPNIATIYDVEAFDGGIALVLELVDGLSLAEATRGARWRTIAWCLNVARQIAAALEAAHDKGIVHFDLKPDNIKLAGDGTVKVIDFGIANQKPDPSEAAPDAPAMPPYVAGTARYMSPEQARGDVTDKRTDIWAFGAVLYELLAGRPAFFGKTTSDTLARVLNAEPDLAALPPGTPESIRRLLRRCLQKDPNLRLRDIGDARIEIEEALSPPPQTAARQTRRFSWRAASVIAAAAMAGAVWMWQSDRTPPTAVVSFRAAFPAGDIPFFGISVSPSGRQIVLCAFNRNNRLRILSIGSPDMRPVPGVESGYMPFWSPDERDVGYFNGDALMRVNLATGRTTRICGSSAPHGATWSRNGFIVFSDRGQLLRVPDTGGAPARIEMDASATEPVSRWSPQLLPDGRHVIFLERTPHGGRVRVGSLDDGKTRTLIHSDTAAVYASGHLLFLQGTALVAERFDLNTLTVDGTLARVAEKVAPAYLSAEPLFSAGGDGVLAYVDSIAGSAGQLTWFESDGRPAGSIDQTDGGELLNPQFSPDGLRLAVNRMDPVTGNWDVWIINLLKGIKTRLTTNAAQDSDPVWSPDGRFVAFASMRDGHPAIYKKAVDGPDAEEKLYEGTDPDSYLVPYQWSSDNQWLLFDSTQRPLRWTVLALPLNGPHVPVRVFPDDGIPRYSPRISPDGKWMAYASGESGVRFDLYVQRFMAPGQKTLVSTESGIHPRWRNDGRELFYWAPPNGIFSVAMTFSGNGFEAGPPEAVIPTAPLTLIDSRAHYDVTPDGRHFLLRQPLQGAASPAATIVVNWTQLLRE